MVPFVVVIADMLAQHGFQMFGRQWDDLSPYLASDRSDETFDVGIEIGRSSRQGFWSAADGSHAALREAGEERVAIHENDLHVFQVSDSAHRRCAQLILRPRAIRVVGEAEQLHFSGRNFDGIEGMMACGAISVGDFEGGEVDSGQMWPMRGNEPLPIIALGSLWCGWKPVPTENGCDRAVADAYAELGQAISDRILAPVGIVLRHVDDQGLGLRVQTWAPSTFRGVSSDDQLATPASEGFDRDDEFLGFEDAAIQSPSENGQSPAFVIGRPNPLANQSFENSRLLVQEVDNQVELLIDGCCAGDDEKGGFVGEDFIAHDAVA